MYDLRSFLGEVKGNREHLVVVDKPVDAKFEACAVVAKLESEGRYPAVLFNKVSGHEMPVVSNVFGDRNRIALAFGVTGQDLNRELREREARPIEPQLVSNAPVQEVVLEGERADLRRLPALVHNQHDAGPYITAGMLVARDPETGIRNIGIYRHMIQGPRQLGIHLAETGHGRLIFDKYMERKQPMPVAITIGHHPLVYMGALSFVPFGVDEYTIMGAYMKQSLRLVKCRTVDLEVPADAEIVIEGVIEPGKTAKDGPFGEYTTVYGKVRENPIIRVTGITMRRDPIYLDVVSGHIDHQLLGGTPRLSTIYKAVRAACPTVKDIYMPPSGCCRFVCFISIRKRHEGEAKNAIAAAMGADPFIKLAVVVDEDVNIFSDSAVLQAVSTRLRPAGNVFAIPNAKTNALDPTCDHELLVTKVGIDATKPESGFPETVSVPGAADIDLKHYL